MKPSTNQRHPNVLAASKAPTSLIGMTAHVHRGRRPRHADHTDTTRKGQPRTMSERIDDTLENIAAVVLNRPSKDDWRYMEGRTAKDSEPAVDPPSVIGYVIPKAWARST